MNQIWIVSCELANQPIPSPNFAMTIAIVKNDIEMDLLTTLNESLITYDLNSTLNFLFQPDTRAIKVTCVVSNNFGSDNASTMIERCGNTLLVCTMTDVIMILYLLQVSMNVRMASQMNAHNCVQ